MQKKRSHSTVNIYPILVMFLLGLAQVAQADDDDHHQIKVVQFTDDGYDDDDDSDSDDGCGDYDDSDSDSDSDDGCGDYDDSDSDSDSDDGCDDDGQVCQNLECQTPWYSAEHLYTDTSTGWEFSWVNLGYEFTPSVEGYIYQLGGSFNGTTQLTLWENVRYENGMPTGDVVTTVTLDNANNLNYEWSFVDLPQPIPVMASQRYAITMYAAPGVFLKMTQGIPEDLQLGDVVVHHGIISEPDKTPTDYPEYMTSWLMGYVDICFLPEGGVLCESPQDQEEEDDDD